MNTLLRINNLVTVSAKYTANVQCVILLIKINNNFHELEQNHTCTYTLNYTKMQNNFLMRSHPYHFVQTHTVPSKSSWTICKIEKQLISFEFKSSYAIQPVSSKNYAGYQTIWMED